MVEEPAFPLQAPAIAHQSAPLSHDAVAWDDDGELVGSDELPDLASVEAGRMGQLVITPGLSHRDVAEKGPDLLLCTGQLKMIPEILREGKPARPALEITLKQSDCRLAATQLDLRSWSPRSQALDPSHASRAQGVFDNQGLPIHLGQNE